MWAKQKTFFLKLKFVLDKGYILKEIIISMLKKNTDHSFISEVTGKNLKEIQKIAKEYNII